MARFQCGSLDGNRNIFIIPVVWISAAVTNYSQHNMYNYLIQTTRNDTKKHSASCVVAL